MFNIVHEFGKVILCVQTSKIINFANILDNGNCMACVYSTDFMYIACMCVNHPLLYQCVSILLEAKLRLNMTVLVQ